MLPCARSLLRRRGLALLRGCAEGECGRGEALANARRVATLAGLGGRGRRLSRCADPPPRVGADRLAGGWRSGAQTRCFLGCGEGEEGSVLSKVYEERRVMGYSPEQMFVVVATVDLYEDFVPWCQRSRIIRRYDNGSFDAELEIGFKFLVESYMSHVEMEKPKYIKEEPTYLLGGTQFFFVNKDAFLYTSLDDCFKCSCCQTIPNVGIYLPEPVFSHGQLYIALSRGVSRQTTRILAKPKKEVDASGKSTKNIVYKDVLAW